MGYFNLDLLNPNSYGTKHIEKVYLKGFTQFTYQNNYRQR